MGYVDAMNAYGEAILQMADPGNQWRGYTEVRMLRKNDDAINAMHTGLLVPRNIPTKCYKFIINIFFIFFFPENC